MADLFETSAFKVKQRGGIVSIDSLPVGNELKKAKLAYAEYLFRNPDEQFKAAVVAVGERLAGYVYNAWSTDLDVTEHIKSLRANDDNEDEILGTKADLCLKLISLSDKYKDTNPKEAIDALKLVAEMRGFKTKPADVQVNNTQVVNKVMMVKSFGDEASWEAAAVDHQRILTGIKVG